VESKTECKSIESFNTVPDLYCLYMTVQHLRNHLQWPGKESIVTAAATTTAIGPIIDEVTNGVAALLPANPGKGHVRRPSTASMSSAASVISEVESEASTENDSGVDGEEGSTNGSSNCLEMLEQNFFRHVQGLRGSMKQLTEAAQYLTKRYQKDVLRTCAN